MAGGHEEHHRERIEAMRAALGEVQGAGPGSTGQGSEARGVPAQYWPKEVKEDDGGTPSTDEEERFASPAGLEDYPDPSMDCSAPLERPYTPTPRSKSLAHEKAGGESYMAGSMADPFGGSPNASDAGEERVRRNLFYPRRAQQSAGAGGSAQDWYSSKDGAGRSAHAQQVSTTAGDVLNPFLTSHPQMERDATDDTSLRLKKRPRVDSPDGHDVPLDKGKGREAGERRYQDTLPAQAQVHEPRATLQQTDVPPPYAMSLEAGNHYLKKLFDEAVDARVRELLAAREGSARPAGAVEGDLSAWMDNALQSVGWPQGSGSQTAESSWTATTAPGNAAEERRAGLAGAAGWSEWDALPSTDAGRPPNCAAPAPQASGEWVPPPPSPSSTRRGASVLPTAARPPPPVPFMTRPATSRGPQDWSTPRRDARSAWGDTENASGPSQPARTGWPPAQSAAERILHSVATGSWPATQERSGQQKMDVDEYASASSAAAYPASSAAAYPATPMRPRVATNTSYTQQRTAGHTAASGSAEVGIQPPASLRIEIGMRLVPWGARIGSMTMELSVDRNGRTYGEHLTSTGVLRVTPPPPGGYPRKHLKSPRDLIRLIPQDAIDLWLAQDDDTKCMLEVYGEGEMTHERAQELSESMSNTVTTITRERGTFVLTAPSLLGRGVKVRRDTSAVWMMSGLSANGTSLVLGQGMWSTPDGTFFVHKLHIEMPEYLFSLEGFTHCVGSTIEDGFRVHFKTGGRIYTSIVNLINEDPARRAFSHQIALDIERTVRIEVTQYPSVDGVRPGRIIANVYCAPPVNNAERWEKWRDSFLTKKFTCAYHSECEAILLKRCEGCHGGDHETPVCPYPRIDGFYGKIERTGWNKKGGAGKARDAPFHGRGDRDDGRWQHGWSDRKSSDQRKGRGDSSRPPKRNSPWDKAEPAYS
ncbi:hypothetical protein FKP32DRAFT_1602764 [Trametes sanguinea]|nr:hypothetical protein FKP32DRAFT_1602764 [Trametes sanguinea]